MGLLDDVKHAAAGTHRGATCSVASWLTTLTTEQAAEFDAALDTLAPATVIHAVITERYGFDRGASTIQRHRRGECSCGPRG